MVRRLLHVSSWIKISFLGLYSNQEDNFYEAYEKDIAVVHFFFQVNFMGNISS